MDTGIVNYAERAPSFACNEKGIIVTVPPTNYVSLASFLGDFDVKFNPL
jgi:hypothetical protein